jgi:hypothetical protein
MSEAGLAATGMQGFLIRGLVFLAAVVFHPTMDEAQRLGRPEQASSRGIS